MLQTQQATLIAEPVRDHLSLLLEAKTLVKGDGDYEIGYEQAKRDIKESMLAMIGGRL